MVTEKKAKFFSTAVKLKVIAYIDGRSRISINAASKCLLNLIASHKRAKKQGSLGPRARIPQRKKKKNSLSPSIN